MNNIDFFGTMAIYFGDTSERKMNCFKEVFLNQQQILRWYIPLLNLNIHCGIMLG